MTEPRPDTTHLQILSAVIRDVARDNQLTPADAEDFRRSVEVSFLERGYDMFQRFAGPGALRRYLREVVGRHLAAWSRSRNTPC